VHPSTRIYAHASPTHQDEEEEELLAWPTTPVGIFFHVILFPLKVFIHFTIPNVRNPAWASWYMTSITRCVVNFFSKY